MVKPFTGVGISNGRYLYVVLETILRELRENKELEIATS
jgi:hypothetical protein